MIQINLNDDQLPTLAKLIAECPQLVALVAKTLRNSRDTYTITEAAEKLGVCGKTIRNRIDAKLIPLVPGIGAKRIPAAWLDKQINPNPDT